MHRRTSFALTALLLAVLLVSVFLQVWVLPHEIERATTTFPEVESLAMPGLAWGVIAIACCQAIVIIGLRLVALARSDQFEESAAGWLRAIVGCLLVFIALIVLAITTLAVRGYSSPATPELVLVGFAALIATVALLVSPATRRPRRREI
jgi:ABC-type transport system involved in multi-copper enzyme maturation permease subunit